MKHLRTWLCWLVLAASGVASAQAQTSPSGATPQVQQAEVLLEQNKPEQAYALLAPLESSLAGEVKYDYLLGISALKSGKASLAVFALERAHATDPGYKEVGLWLGIAYYQSGDLERAKPAFEGVVQHGSGAARDKAQRYLDVLQQEEARRRHKATLTGKLEFGVGHDSNITNSSLGTVNASQYAASLLAPSSNQGGWETVMNLGVEGRVPVSGDYLYLSADDQRRDYNGNDFMNANMVTMRGGLMTDDNGSQSKYGLWQRHFRQQGTLFAINGIANDYDIGGAEASTRRKLSSQSYLGFNAQYNQVRFLSNSPDDTDQLVAGTNYMHLFQTRGKPVLYLGYSYLYDQAVGTKVSYNPQYGDGTTTAGRATHFISGYFRYSISSDVDLESTDYVFFRRDTGAYARSPIIDYGRDRTTYLSLGANWEFSPKWTLRSRLARTSSRSNIPGYSYDKTELLFTVRRDFN